MLISLAPDEVRDKRNVAEIGALVWFVPSRAFDSTTETARFEMRSTILVSALRR